MAAPRGIDWQWALRTGGALSSRQKLHLLAPLARVVLSYPGVRVRLAANRRGSASFDLDALRYPDTALALAAVEHARATLPAFLLEHSFRTYLFGLMLAQVQRTEIDQEIAFVASMLHDTRLGHPTPGRCFAVTGGEHARDLALEHGAEHPIADVIGAAVAGHITMGASEDVGDPAGFVSAGALADLTAVGLHHTSPQWVAAVFTAHPCKGFREQILQAWRAEAAAVPDGRARWLNRYAAFPTLVRLAPLDD